MTIGCWRPVDTGTLSPPADTPAQHLPDWAPPVYPASRSDLQAWQTTRGPVAPAAVQQAAREAASRRTSAEPTCASCGHPYSYHGDRAVAACTPPGQLRDKCHGSIDTPFGPRSAYGHFYTEKCYCRGWRPRG